MAHPSEDYSETAWGLLVARARAGSKSALGLALESCRLHLMAIANRRVHSNLRSKAGPSDLVQETLLEAHRDFSRFRGRSREEWRAWLSKILLNNLDNFARRYLRTAKRRVADELSLDEPRADGTIKDSLVDQHPTPCTQLARDEERRALEHALGLLPESYRRVIVLRHRERLRFEEIAHRMGRTEAATRKLWLRALVALQEKLGRPS